MAEVRNRNDVTTALLRVASVFTIDFVINIVWSLAMFIAFSMVNSYTANSLAADSGVVDEILKSPEYLFFVSIYNVFAIMITFLFWKHVDKVSTAVIGLRWRKNSLRMMGLGLLGGSLEILLIMLISFGFGTLWFQSYGSTLFSWPEIAKSFIYGVLAFLLVGFGEEALFRGYIQKRLMLSIGNKWALFLGSLIFMAAHVFTYGRLLDFVDVALGGAILGYLYILTDSLYLPAAYHFVYDLIQVNIVRLQDYEHFKGAVMLIYENTGDVVLRGINYGNVIEVSFVIAELIVLLLLYIFRDKVRKLA